MGPLATGVTPDLTCCAPVKVWWSDKWVRGRVVERVGKRIKTHYDGWNTRFDEWHAIDSKRVQVVSLADQVGEPSMNLP